MMKWHQYQSICGRVRIWESSVDEANGIYEIGDFRIAELTTDKKSVVLTEESKRFGWQCKQPLIVFKKNKDKKAKTSSSSRSYLLNRDSLQSILISLYQE
jgi:uncharacterized protein YjhX (UPF0386 family)